MPPPQMPRWCAPSPSAARRARRVAISTLSLAMMLLGACTSPNILAEGPTRDYAWQHQPGWSGAASDTQALLNGPEAQWVEDSVSGPGNLPEFARRDRALAVSDGPARSWRLTSGRSPHGPDLDYTRTLYLPVGRGERFPITYSSDRPLPDTYRGHYRGYGHPWHGYPVHYWHDADHYDQHDYEDGYDGPHHPYDYRRDYGRRDATRLRVDLDIR